MHLGGGFTGDLGSPVCNNIISKHSGSISNLWIGFGYWYGMSWYMTITAKLKEIPVQWNKLNHPSDHRCVCAMYSLKANYAFVPCSHAKGICRHSRHDKLKTCSCKWLCCGTNWINKTQGLCLCCFIWRPWKCYAYRRDFHLKFPFSKREFGGRPCDLLRMTCQGQTFFDELCPVRTLISKKQGSLVTIFCQKRLDLERSS